jgi:hypothetical protein
VQLGGAEMKKHREKMNRAEILERDLIHVCRWEKNLGGLEAKAWNVEMKHGSLPRGLQDELIRAEMEYGFALALYKDNRKDPYL